MIQRNAIASWSHLRPAPEIILFGDDEGTAALAAELGLRHEPEVARNQFGTPLVNDLFGRAQQVASGDVLAYVNADIALTNEFTRAVDEITRRRDTGQFMLTGRRWNTPVESPLKFHNGWERELLKFARERGEGGPPQALDYFVFSRGLYAEVPAFAIGRTAWDNWLIWHARASGAMVADASAVVLAVHQNHDYSSHPGGEAGVWQGEEAKENIILMGGPRHFYTLDNATHLLTPAGLRQNYRHWTVLAKREAQTDFYKVWFALLKATRPIRRRLGLRQDPPSALVKDR